MIWESPAKRAVIAFVLAAAPALSLSSAAFIADAQAPSPASADRKSDPESVQTFYLANISDINDLNDIQTSLRNMFPRARNFSVPTQFAITVRGTQEDLDASQKLIASLDRPRKAYRLTYSITDSENGKRTGTQKFVVLAAAGQRSVFKQGTRVPIVTGMYERNNPSHENTQVQYLDVGLMIEGTVTGVPDALGLRSKIEQTSLVPENTAMSAQDPKLHQTVLDESFQLVQGKPLVLASFDIPGTTRHQEIEVVAEPAK